MLEQLAVVADNAQLGLIGPHWGLGEGSSMFKSRLLWSAILVTCAFSVAMSIGCGSTGQTSTQTTPSGTPPALAHSVDLSWTASTSTVTGYNVWRSTQSGSGYQLITPSVVTGTTYTDSTVQSGATYYYVVTAVEQGIESAYSNEALAPIPIP